MHYLTGDNAPVQIGDRVAFADALTAELHAAMPSQVYIMGHSYGGWLALQTVLAWPGSLRVTDLFSIDPISQIDCTFSNPAGCTTFPGDVDNAQRAQIAASVTAWENFYETGTFYLHSASVDQATENTLVDGATHYTIETDQMVWDHIDARIFGVR